MTQTPFVRKVGRRLCLPRCAGNVSCGQSSANIMSDMTDGVKGGRQVAVPEIKEEA